MTCMVVGVTDEVAVRVVVVAVATAAVGLLVNRQLSPPLVISSSFITSVIVRQ